ncbi:MAG: efflux RND transporter periplasmic adaptor subunit, partial [Bacteroidia bacterium]|nr:efflux RND transporter periplasmic adaptor subunit [Bacteroidia bacterium]
GNKPEEVKKEDEHKEDSLSAKVGLTKEQFKIAGIEVGSLELKALSGTIKVNGMLDVPPQNLVSISAPLGGFVKNTELLQGMKVTKGQTIAVMQHPDYIQLQQDFLESKSQLEYLEAEYKRQQELAKENVNSSKVLQQAKAQYFGMQARYSGLKSKLNLIGINAENLSAEKIQQFISIPSPINGYVTHVNVNIGSYVNPNDVMFQIVDTEHLHAELTVFEKDVPKLKIGQKVRFTLANEEKERHATIHLIGREIDKDRTVRVHCHLDEEDNQLIPGMYLKALVETNSSEVYTLPNEAIIDFEGKKYIFVATEGDFCTDKECKEEKPKDYGFEMVEIKTGVSEMNFTEIIFITEVDKESDIVVKGAYDLLSKMKNSEGDGCCAP